MAGDWVPMRGYGSQVTLDDLSPSVDFILVRHGVEDPGADNTGHLEFADDIVTQRCIGQVRCVVDEGAALVAMRIRVGLYDDQLDQAAFFATTLFSGDDANEPFLWQRYMYLAAQDTFDPLTDPWWSALDVRVARRLSRDQALFLSLEKAGPGVAVRVSPYLRTFARMAK